MKNKKYYNRLFEQKLLIEKWWDKIKLYSWNKITSGSSYFTKRYQESFFDEADIKFFEYYYQKLLNHCELEQVEDDHFYNLLKVNYEYALRDIFKKNNALKRKILYNVSYNYNDNHTNIGSNNHEQSELFNIALYNLINNNFDNDERHALFNYFGLNDKHNHWSKEKILSFYNKNLSWWYRLYKKMGEVVKESNIKEFY